MDGSFPSVLFGCVFLLRQKRESGGGYCVIHLDET
jgi:hypothetical protein